MGAHRRSGGLAMSSCNAETFVALGKCTEYLSALLNLEAILAEELQLLMLSGNRWCVDNQARLLFLALVGDVVYTFMVMNQHSF